MCKILLVDDGDDLIDLAEVHLSAVGHQVRSASNGREALQFLSDHEHDPPCIVITDLRMPVLDGWDLVYAIKMDPKWADLPIIICSASIVDGAPPPLLRAKDYWPRRPSPEQFQRIHQYCRRHHHSWPPLPMGEASSGESSSSGESWNKIAG